MRPSIRRRLLTLLLGVITLVWLITMVESYRETQHEIRELFDAQLAQSARTLLTMAGHELNELEGLPEVAHIHFLPPDSDDEESEYEYKIAYQLWMQPQNKLILRSYKTPEEPLSQIADGYTTETIGGKPWRIFSLTDKDSGFQIKMGESLEIRQELSDEIAARMALPMLIALPLLALLILLGINRGLQPLQRLAQAISQRDPSHLQRVETQHTPSELTPIINALNHLFARVEQSLEGERRFTADAAHELRTPLAALKIQAQVAQRSSDRSERERALAQLSSGIDRSTHLVEQLLTLARIDPERAPQNFNGVELRPLAEEVIATLEPLASAKGIELQLQCGGEPKISAQADSIAIALRNLVDNAIRYTPEQGSVVVTIEESDTQVLLSVCDSGSGIPEAERGSIFNRFHRLAGQEVEGSGLGLSIVQRIAELHHATIKLQQSPMGGLEVTLHFRGYNV